MPYGPLNEEAMGIPQIEFEDWDQMESKGLLQESQLCHLMAYALVQNLKSERL